MVDPDTVLTALYVTVAEYLQDGPVAVRRGPAARLTPSAGVTLALFGQWQQCATAQAFSRDAVQHLRGACPTLPARSQDNRLLRRGHDVIVAVGQPPHRGGAVTGLLTPRRTAPAAAS